MASAETLTPLLARCALRDRAAFEALYRAASPQLFGIVLRIVRDRELAADVLQEAFVKIWQRAGDFRPDIAAPITWMGAIARNQAIDAVRRPEHRLVDPEPVEALYWLADDSAGPAEQTTRALEDEALHRCLERLQGMQKRAMLLAWFNGMTHEELAVHLATPLGTVKSWLRRGLMRLKTCLEEL